MPKKRPIPKSPAENAEEMQLSCAASSTDCTGLIPNLPEDEEAAEAYKDIYDFGPPDPADYALPNKESENQ